MNRLYKILYSLFFVFVFCIALLLAASALPIPGGIKTFVVQSGSMEPAVHTGSIVVVKPQSTYKIGDIITFGPNTKNKVPTTHRIVEMRVQTGSPVYVTKGDANDTNDQREIPASEIIGKVHFSLPFFGYAVAAAKKPIGFAILIAVPAAILIFDELKKIWLEIRRMKKKKETLGLPDELMPGKEGPNNSNKPN